MEFHLPGMTGSHGIAVPPSNEEEPSLLRTFDRLLKNRDKALILLG